MPRPIGVMFSSFCNPVVERMHDVLRADLYISPLAPLLLTTRVAVPDWVKLPAPLAPISE